MITELEKKRIERGLNYTQASNLTGVSRTAIKKYERGAMPGADVASRYAEALGITVAQLIALIEKSKAQVESETNQQAATLAK